MAVQTKVGTFVKATGHSVAYSQAVAANIPFEPQALEIWGAGNTNLATFNTGATSYGLRLSRGFSAAPGNSYSLAVVNSERDLFGTDNAGGDIFSRAINICQFNIFGIHLEAAADLASYDSLGGGLWGFTLNWVTTTAAYPDRQLFYRAWGGLSDAFVLHSGTETGTVTGVGFCSDLVRVLGSKTAPDEATFTGVNFSIGGFNHIGEQWASAIWSGGSATSDSKRAQLTDCFAIGIGTTGGLETKSFDAMTNDGFEISGTGNETSLLGTAYLCLKGVASHFTSFNKATSTGNQTISLALTPIDLELVGFHLPTDATSEDHARLTMGAVDADGHMRAAMGLVADNVAATDAHADGYSVESLFVKADNNTRTVEAVAEITSFGTNEAVINWTTNDSDADEILALAIAATGDYGRCVEDTIELEASVSTVGAPGIVVAAEITGTDLAESITLSASALMTVESFLTAAPEDEPGVDLGSADVLLLFDIFLKAWSIWPDVDVTSLWTVRDATTGVESVFAGGRNGVVRVLNQPGVTNAYDGIAAHTSALGEQGIEKSPRYLFLYFKEQGAITVTVNTYFDFSPTPTQTLEVSLAGDGALLGVNFILGTSTLGGAGQLMKRLDLKGTGEFLTIKINNDAAGEIFTWLGYEVLWRPRRIVRRG